MLATGAYDRPVAFPGWTLPGVMTAGGAQALAKGQGVVPGRRVLLAGAGPFLLPVAAQLAQVRRRGRRRRRGHAPPRLGRAPARGWPPIPAGCVDYARYRTTVAGTCWGHVIVRAEGDGRVESATIARAGPDWASDRRASEPSRSTPSAPPTASCRPSTSPARSAASSTATRSPTTTTCARPCPNVFVAGEATGVGGADLAQVEGELAGWMAAAHALRSANGNGHGHAPPRQPDLPGPARAAGEGRGLRRASSSTCSTRGRACSALAASDTILCRCEDVTAGAVDAAVAGGATTMSALKIVTRCGQGPCQGRTCERLVAARLPGARALQRPGPDAADPARRPDGRRELTQLTVARATRGRA